MRLDAGDLGYARPVAAHRLDVAEARRIAIRAQLLDAPRPTDLLDVVDRLTMLQIDPTAAVAPSADLVAWSRLGPDYRPADLQQALEVDRTLFEWNAVVRPMADLRLFLADMATWPRHERSRAWLEANDRFRRDILERLADAGPLLSRDIADTSQVPWPSTGWTNDRNVTQMLEFLMTRGEVAIAGRIGRQRTWDLAERVYPADTPVVPHDEAHRIRAERRLRSLGIARATGTAVPIDSEHRGRGRRAGDGRGRPRHLARRPGAARPAVRRPHRPAVAVRPPDLRPQAGRRPVRLRVRPRDVQAGGEASMGLLRAADPPRRPARGQARRGAPIARRRSSSYARSTRTSRSRATSPRASTRRSSRSRRGSAWTSSSASRHPDDRLREPGLPSNEAEPASLDDLGRTGHAKAARDHVPDPRRGHAGARRSRRGRQRRVHPRRMVDDLLGRPDGQGDGRDHGQAVRPPPRAPDLRHLPRRTGPPHPRRTAQSRSTTPPSTSRRAASRCSIGARSSISRATRPRRSRRSSRATGPSSRSTAAAT